MKIKRNKHKYEYKIKKIFLIMYGVWLLDFLLTFIALNFLDNFYEVNPFASFFYSHWWGWLIFPLIAMSIILGYSYLLKGTNIYMKNELNKQINFPINFGVLIFVIPEIVVIFHNLILMIK